MVTTLFSKEGVTQGDPLAMFWYRIGILPLICIFKKEDFPEVRQPWYANDAGASGSFSDLCRFFAWLQEIGPSYGYFPEPSKTILVVQVCSRAQLGFSQVNFCQL
jgi:hypothetical protein